MPRRASNARSRKKRGEAKSNGISDLMKQLWQAAVNLRGSIEPPEYEPFEEKLPRLTALLKEHMKESAKLDEHIAGVLKELGHGR